MDPVIEAMARTVSHELDTANRVGEMLVDTFAAALSMYLVRTYSSTSPTRTTSPPIVGALPKHRLTRVLDRIEQHLHQDINLQDLAREACLSPFHFARCFKATTGLSPYAYVVQRRLSRARHLLQRRDMTIADIAAACGFGSQAHFATAFKRNSGLTPRAFRDTL